MYYITIAYFGLSGLIWKYFIATPAEIGITVTAESFAHDDGFKVVEETENI
jgi:hypothetical protein